MMKKFTLMFLFLIPFIGISQASSSKIVGVWLTEIKDAKVEIYKKNNKYYGKVIWVKEPNDENGKPIVDSKNPVASKKNQPILGMDIITDLVFEDNEWSGGTVYDPKDGKSYDCKIWLEGGKIKLRGYSGWFFDTKTWTRVK